MQRWERIADRVAQETAPTRRPLTKGAIAKELGISRPALERRLKGKPEWHYSELEKLAALFGITVDELINDDDEGAA